VVGAFWDNECVACTDNCYFYDIPKKDQVPDGPVVDLNCPITKTHCDAEMAVCDPEIFISWLGTDTKGNTMYSAGNPYQHPLIQPHIKDKESQTLINFL